jgi:hypothetical protein
MVTIIKGEDKDLVIRLTKQSNGEPFDITSISAATVKFKNTDGTDLTLTLSDGVEITGDGKLGKLTASISAAESALLLGVLNKTLEVSFTLNAKVNKVQIDRAYSIVESIG